MEAAVEQVTPEGYRAALRMFASGVTVVTSTTGQATRGMTASAFAALSLDPPLVLVCVARTARMHYLIARAKVFAVTVLASDQRDLAVHFAGPGRGDEPAELEGAGWRPAAVTGCPVHDGGMATIDCRLRDTLDAGDHTVFVGEVAAVEVAERSDPLLYYDGAYRRLDL